MNAEGRARHIFSERFGEPAPTLIRAPGRVNLIGDHTDYADGFVLPLAIDRAIWLALRPRYDRTVRVWAELPGAWAEFDLDALSRRRGWSAYLEGVAHILAESGAPTAGFEGVLTSDLPAGAGLSSSAALEMAAARAFAEVAAHPWDPVAMAVVGRRAENEWVGMQCGIMDQLICATGRAGHAMLIDCRSLARRPVAIPNSVAVVVLDTTTRRDLVESAYNERRAACDAAASAFGVAALRDLDTATLRAGAHRLSPTVHRRARHVVNENAATLAAAAALERGDVARAGALMNASHASLADDYQVSSLELDAMAAAARAAPGCHGARMTGAGFGGSVVALVAAARVESFTRSALRSFRTATGLAGTAMEVTPSDGVAVVP